MSTFTQILYQIVFSTKNREKVLTKNNREELFKYIWGITKNKKCHLYQINGVEDHLHILIDLHPSIALSSLVKEIKVASTLHIKEKKLFDNFANWQQGYGAFTYNIQEKNRLIGYIKKQEEHHKSVTFLDEYKELLVENKIPFIEKYLI